LNNLIIIVDELLISQLAYTGDSLQSPWAEQVDQTVDTVLGANHAGTASSGGGGGGRDKSAKSKSIAIVHMRD